jgi:hypothetical protein
VPSVHRRPLSMAVVLVRVLALVGPGWSATRCPAFRMGTCLCQWRVTKCRPSTVTAQGLLQGWGCAVRRGWGDPWCWGIAQVSMPGTLAL